MNLMSLLLNIDHIRSINSIWSVHWRRHRDVLIASFINDVECWVSRAFCIWHSIIILRFSFADDHFLLLDMSAYWVRYVLMGWLDWILVFWYFFLTWFKCWIFVYIQLVVIEGFTLVNSCVIICPIPIWNDLIFRHFMLWLFFLKSIGDFVFSSLNCLFDLKLDIERFTYKRSIIGTWLLFTYIFVHTI